MSDIEYIRRLKHIMLVEVSLKSKVLSVRQKLLCAQDILHALKKLKGG